MRDAMGDNRGRMDHRGRHDLMDHRSGVDDGGGVDSLGVPGLALVADLHHSAAIAAISGVGHVLDPAVRERHAVLALDVPLGVPGPALAEVGVVLIVMDSISEVEGVGLVVLLMVTSVRHFMDHGDRHHMASGVTMTTMSNETNASDTIRERNTGHHREDRETGD